MPDLGCLLIALARASIERRLGLPVAALPQTDQLAQPAAVFVTLTQAGVLRGCIGSLEAHRPLIDDLQANACAAAFRDPRFPPLSVEEWPATRVEVSLLSPSQPLSFSDEADALRQLRPGIDGVILQYRGHRATFLPQVWEQLPQAREFLAHLKRKAGLHADFWAHDLNLARYSVQKFSEALP
jgi:AmmeMemoRadiSam system protein A